MEGKEKDQKKTLLSVLGVAILVVAVIGISFAAYSATYKNPNANSIKTGTITVSYAEDSTAINLVNAIPLSDDNGKALTGDSNVFDFSVTTTTSNAVTIPYTITLTKVTCNQNCLADSEVKVYMTAGANVVRDVAKISALDTVQSGAREGSYILYDQAKHTHSKGESITTDYSLRMWVSADTALDGTVEKTYSAKVNVDSTVNALS